MPSQATSSLATIVGGNIRKARDLRGLTQRQLADLINADPMQVSKWERAWNKPSEENLAGLAEALHQSLAWFYTDHPDEQVA